MLTRFVVAIVLFAGCVVGQSFSFSSSTLNATGNDTDVNIFSDTVTNAIGQASLASALSSASIVSNTQDDAGYTPTAQTASNSRASAINSVLQTNTATQTTAIGDGSFAGSIGASDALSLLADSNGDVPKSSSDAISVSSLIEGTANGGIFTQSAAIGELTAAYSQSNLFVRGADVLFNASTQSNDFGTIFSPTPTAPAPAPATTPPSPSPSPIPSPVAASPIPSPAAVSPIASPPAAPPSDCQTADVILGSDPSLSTMLNFLTAAGIITGFQGDGPSQPVSLLAPTNTAFQNLAAALERTVDQLLEVPGIESVLAYHITAPFLLSQVSDGAILATAQGQELTISVPSAGTVVIQGGQSSANVVSGDVQGCNVIVHTIDTVLIPNTQ